MYKPILCHFSSYYVGAYPNVTIADLELVKEIMVKNFDIFRDRGLLVSVLRDSMVSGIHI